MNKPRRGGYQPPAAGQTIAAEKACISDSLFGRLIAAPTGDTSFMFSNKNKAALVPPSNLIVTKEALLLTAVYDNSAN